MFKKIALVAALAASASFATYSFFPVGDANKGEATIGPSYFWHNDWSMMQINANVKYNVIQNLELSLQGLGYQLWSEDEHCDDNGAKCPDTDGLLAMTIGARYQFMPMLIAALDVKVPLNAEDVVGKYDPLGFYGAIQFTQELVTNLILGSELGLTFDLEDENVSHGLVLTLQAELDYSIASIGLTPWVGLSFNYKLTNDEYDTALGKVKEHSGNNGLTIWVGGQYDINTMLGVKANFIINTGDSMSAYGGDNKAKGVNGALVVRF